METNQGGGMQPGSECSGSGVSGGAGAGGLDRSPGDTSGGESREGGQRGGGLASSGASCSSGDGERGGGRGDASPGGERGGERELGGGGVGGSGDGGGQRAGSSFCLRERCSESDPGPVEAGCSFWSEQQQRGGVFQPIERGGSTGLFGQLLFRARRRREGRASERGARHPGQRDRSRSRSRDRRGSGTELVRWEDVMHQYAQGDSMFSEQYSFEQIITYPMKPEDDWSEMFKRHAKVSLNANKVYTLKNKIDCEGPVYVIGNGAKVIVEGELDCVIQVHPKNPGPSVTNMWGVVFTNVQFERGTSFTGTLARCHSFTVFHGCSFSGFVSTVLQLLAGGEVKGCCFMANYRCVLNESRNVVLVKSCTFDKCILGVIGRGPCNVIYTAFRETYCAALFQVHGRFRFNTVVDPTALADRSNLLMGSCAEGNMTALCAVHIVGNFASRYVEMSHCQFLRADVYVGCRSGVWTCPQSSFNFSRIYVTAESQSRISMTGTYTCSLRIMKMYRPDIESYRGRLCECGAMHGYYPMMLVDVTQDLLLNPCLHSVDSLDYSSDEEDQVGLGSVWACLGVWSRESI
ncbi:large T-antigen [Bat mastadenovirus WIV10]|uniref:Large T-antigen n=1 Tax=Bat mastadenovirus WIV10 TaxID=1788432 RepID=A0A163HJA4_9ADEN|nr:large T-antigen [Bat mastadenovirus WIV10]AMB43079.1 large T-antigen [Bat mastadenovirus WIV10]